MRQWRGQPGWDPADSVWNLAYMTPNILCMLQSWRSCFLSMDPLAVYRCGKNKRICTGREPGLGDGASGQAYSWLLGSAGVAMRMAGVDPLVVSAVMSWSWCCACRWTVCNMVRSCSLFITVSSPVWVLRTAYVNSASNACAIVSVCKGNTRWEWHESRRYQCSSFSRKSMRTAATWCVMVCGVSGCWLPP